MLDIGYLILDVSFETGDRKLDSGMKLWDIEF
jgi:hypothetical protein